MRRFGKDTGPEEIDMAANHLDQETLARLVDGEAIDEAAWRHFIGCGDCFAAYAETAALKQRWLLEPDAAAPSAAQLAAARAIAGAGSGDGAKAEERGRRAARRARQA